MFKAPESLDDYLSQIARELRALPAQARADELREIEAHLRTMIEARGDVAGVLAQFGKPRKVGRDLRRAWARKQPESWINSAVALVIGCFFAVGHNYFWFNMLNTNLFFLNLKPYYLLGGELLDWHLIHFLSYFLLEGVFSLILGFYIGVISPKNGNSVVFLTLLLILFLDVSCFFPIGAVFYFFRYFTMPKYAYLVSLLLIGARFGARHTLKHLARIADAK